MMSAMMTVQPMSFVPVQAADYTSTANGELDIEMNLSLPTKRKIFSVSLEGKYKKEMNVNADGTKAAYSFKDLIPGSYELKIEAEGYIPYTQTVNITQGMTTKVALDNNKQVNQKLAPNKDKKYGVMLVGDINNDGSINKADADMMMNAIDAGESNTAYDLNGDQKVDVADLTYITMNYDGKNVIAIPLEMVSSDKIEVKAGDTTAIKGNVDDLTENKDTFVQFKPTSGEISEQNPVEVSLDLNGTGNEAPKVDGIVITAPANTENIINEGAVIVETETGEKIEATITRSNNQQLRYVARTATTETATATIESDGSIVINLGKQIAIKKVTIKVTGASTNLVDIAQVEFVNGMENRIPEPELNIPTDVEISQISSGKDISFTVRWKAQPNVTGYSVLVSGDGKQTEIKTTDTSLKITNLNGKLSTYVPYTVRVCSTNGEDWKSPYSESKTVTIKPDAVPPAPEGVSVTGKTQAISVSWKKMQDTQRYSAFYREQNTGEYKEISGITTNNYTITELKPGVAYQVYVVGYWNGNPKLYKNKWDKLKFKQYFYLKIELEINFLKNYVF